MSVAAYDVIIVGAGAAGCVLAGRLSEVSSKRVLLVEAGPDAPAGQEHRDIRDPYPVALGNPAFTWPGLAAEVGADRGDGRRASRGFLQGYGVGGSSNIQGTVAFRGQPADYDEWRDAGAAGWGWDDVLPYFRKLERDLDFSGPLHGDHGPMPIRRVRRADWAPFSRAFADALVQRGFPLIDDYNAQFGDGVSALPMASLPDRRVSASMAYLPVEVRRRGNLTVAPDTFVDRLLLKDGRVTGVAVSGGQGVRRFLAPQVIVCCGSVFTPALLMRAGIGSEAHLRALGIEVACDLPGVGRNLQNHPKIELAVHLPRASTQSLAQAGFGQSCLRLSSGVAGGRGDLGLVAVNRAAWHPELLVSKGRELVLTPLAASLLDPTQSILMQIQALYFADKFDAGSSRRNFHVLADEQSLEVCVPQLVQAFAASAPFARLTVGLLHTSDMDRFERGELDLIIGPDYFLPALHPSGLLYADGWVCIAAAANNRFTEPLTVDQLRSARHVIREPRGNWINHGPLDIAFQAPSYNHMVNAIEETGLLGILPRLVGLRYASRLPLKVLAHPDPPQDIQHFAQWHRHRRADEGIVWLRRLLFSLSCFVAAEDQA